jgi:hypothetical protein
MQRHAILGPERMHLLIRSLKKTVVATSRTTLQAGSERECSRPTEGLTQ